MNQERLQVERSTRGPHPAADNLLKGSMALAVLVGVASIPWVGFEHAIELIPGIFVVLVLPSFAIVEALGLSKHRQRPPVQVCVDLTSLEVEGRRFSLAELRWQRRPGGLWLGDGSEELILKGLANREVLERFLERHIQRAARRHGAGESEVPEALTRVRSHERS